MNVSLRALAPKPHTGYAAVARALLAAALLSALAPAQALEPLDLAAFTADNLDMGTAPGDDFNRFVNGNWERSATIPPESSRVDLFRVLGTQTQRNTVRLLESADPAMRQPHDFYAAYMDEAGIEAQGLRPVQAVLARIGAIADKVALARALGESLRADVDPLNTGQFYTENLFGLWVAPGLHDPRHYQPYLLQGGLGMVDREYYLARTAKMARIRGQYQAHIAAVLRLGGFGDSDARAARVLALERHLAMGHVDRETSEDVSRADNRWTPADFARLAPGLAWSEFFAAAGLQDQTFYTVWHPGAVKGAAAWVARTPLPVWKDYLAFHALNHFAGVLPRVFGQQHHAFYGKTMLATPQPQPRWKQALAATNLALGDAVGQLYVAHHFSADARAKAQAMIDSIVKAFGQRITQLDWMAPATKAEAQAKLRTLYVGVGYPDRWTDYAALAIAPDDALGNVARSEVFAYRQYIAKLGGPVDTHAWAAPVQIVNAFSVPLQNALIFPAAILQPPFFDPNASDAVNYGAIGAVIGHEIAHNFDSQGAKFDADGRLRDWWAPADLAHFQQSTAALARQFSAYRPFPDLAVNGPQTSSENIADLAGVLVAHTALRATLATQQMTPEQVLAQDRQFFITFAKNWRGKLREPALRQHIISDGHAPGPYRAATVRNLDAWYTAFDVKAGQRLYLPAPARVRMW